MLLLSRNSLQALAMPLFMATLLAVTMAGWAHAQEAGKEAPPEKQAPKQNNEEPRKPTQFPNAGKDPAQPINEADTVRLDQELEFFKYVEDNAPLLLRGQKLDQKRELAAEMELRAYDYVLAFASKIPLDALERHSYKKIPYRNFYKEIRQDYLRELIHIEGRLAQILPLSATKELQEIEKINKLYECWIAPKGEREYCCLVVSELPEGIEVGEDLNRQVSFDAYYFKLWHYETREKKPNSEKHVWRMAPLFLGRSFRDLGEIETDTAPYSSNMLSTIVMGLGVIVLLVVGAALWFRLGDRKVKNANARKIQDNANLESL